ncbi:MAG: hypothetical protein KC419_26390, partial [Anaerolineales bacterium]|nr:hypothetical protein [Anaerolineales bacterium]
MMTTLHELTQNDHAPWLHYLRRSFIESGELSAIIEDGIRGITVDLGVIERAIAYSADYDRFLTQLQTEGVPFDVLPRAMLVDDVQRAAYILNPVHEQSNRLDGYVSLPIDPALAHKTTETVATVRHLLADINCPNVMVEIPATDAGIEAIEKLTMDGVCINATQIYNLATYERVAQAYMTGLADYIRTHSVWRQWPTSIATIAISHLDRKMADVLAPHKRSDLIDKTGIALAQAVYGRYQEIFSGPQWQKMADKGAYPQRLLWTSLAPHDFRHEETYYSDALCVPGTISDLSPSLLNIFRERRSIPHPFILQAEQAKGHMAALAALSIDMEAVAEQLQAEDLAYLAQQLETLRESVRQKRAQMEDNWQRLHWQLGEMETAVSDSLSHLCTDRIMCRIWRHDPTVWQAEPDEISNRMGWLHLMPAMRSQIDRLHTMTDGLLADGFTHAMLLGMGGSGLAPHLFTETFTQAALPPRPGLPPRPHLHLNVLANTDPATILAQTERLDLRHTLFVVASKSGRTVETMA